MEQALGKAAYQLCTDPQYGHLRGPKLERVTSAEILNFGAAVRYAGEFHHTQLAVVLWNRGRLSAAHNLTEEELAEAIRLLEEERSRRAAST